MKIIAIFDHYLPPIHIFCIVTWGSGSMTTLNTEEVTLSSASEDWGVYLPLSVNDNIEQ